MQAVDDGICISTMDIVANTATPANCLIIIVHCQKNKEKINKWSLIFDVSEKKAMQRERIINMFTDIDCDRIEFEFEARNRWPSEITITHSITFWMRIASNCRKTLASFISRRWSTFLQFMLFKHEWNFGRQFDRLPLGKFVVCDSSI